MTVADDAKTGGVTTIPVTAGRPWQRFGTRGIYLLVVLVMVVLVIIPMIMLLIAAFTDSPPRPGDPLGNFTVENFNAILTSRGITAAVNSIIIAVCAGAFAVAIGTGLAWVAARTDVPWRAVAQTAGIIPLFISAFVGAMAWSLVASPRSGYINLLFSTLGWNITWDVYSIGGIIFVQSLYYSPYPFLFVYGALRLMNPELEEAALVHGARQWTVVTNVTLPIIRPALLGAGVLTFALILEDFPIPTILGAANDVQTLPSYVYSLMTVAPSEVNQASAVGIVLLALLVIIIVTQRLLLKGKAYTTVSGKGFRPGMIKLGRWRWPVFSLVMLYLFLAIVVPIAALAVAAFSGARYLSSFRDLFDPSAYSADAFIDSVTSRAFIQATSNSFIAGGAAALFGLVLFVLLAYFVLRTNLIGKRFLGVLTVAPVAIPSLVMGIAFFWTWSVIPLPVYGTLAVLVLAYIARFIPQGYGGIAASMEQIHPDLEAAAEVSGAGKMRALWWATVPLLRTSIISAGLMVLILSIRELASSIFLFTSRTRVLSVLVFGQWENGQWDRVASMSLAYSAILLVITVVGGKWLKPA
ncbi:iron ABC transporter permease [Microbacterium soli]|uniref:Iron ABC transporter permease n=1 Tax=Microbacterium soli TaxID=446075 RepID=A0ABP7MSZ0_9MICO